MSVIVSALVCFLLCSLVQGQNSEVKCPSKCLCSRTTVRCMFLQLDTIPRIPPETTVLDLRFNKIREILPGTFKDLKHLNTLLLNNNHILRLENGAFDGLEELKYLYLYKNRIKDIDAKVFHNLHKLEQLYLHFNKIETLPSGLFDSLLKLDRLFLHNNKLQRIPSGAFGSLGEMKRLRLDSNALICDCQLLWLAKLLQEKGEETQAAVTCLHPSPMKGKSLTQLLEEEEFYCKKPQLTEEPTDIEIKFGKTAYLTCKAEGDPLPDIVWLRNNNEIAFEDDPRLQMLEDGTLMIENATSEDFGTYECMAKSPLGEVKSRTVRMSPPQDLSRRSGIRPRFVHSPKDVSVNVGEIAIFRCEVYAVPPANVTWFLNEAQIVNSERIELRSDGNLEIRDVLASDAGNYRCTAVNPLGRASSVARLIVQEAPRILEPPTTHSAWEGSAVEFNCYVEGQPVPSIIWLKDDSPVIADNRISLFVGGTKLRLQQVRVSDQGRYKCRVENVAGVASAEAHLFVFQSIEGKRAPRIISLPRAEITSRLGASLELKCEAEGLPNPTVVWRKDGATLAPHPQTRVLVGGYLQIRRLVSTDQGTYECVALNDAGHVTSKVRVVLSDVLRGPSYADISYIQAAVDDARQTVNQAVDDTLQIVYRHHAENSSNVGGHGALLRANRFPNADARAIAFSAEVYDTALDNLRNFIRSVGNMSFNNTDFNYTEVLPARDLQLLANLSGCSTHRSEPDCSNWCFHSKYRTHDGTCNNMAKPMLGSSYTAFKRLLPNAYEDGFNQPVGWRKSKLYHGYPKPSARLVSTRVISTKKITEDEEYTHMLMQWGQFLDHDLDLAVPGIAFESFSNRIDCRTSCDQSNPCFPIEVPEGDPRIRSTNCMEFTRNSAVCGSGESSAIYSQLLPREQINQLTSYIDASMIYGSTEEESRQVRDLPSNRGMLRIGLTGPGGKPFLPFASERQHVDCKRDRRESNLNCFLAGDVRANEQTALLTMHTLWFREHNRIATLLRRVNPHWDGETLYQEARKIVGGVIQHITYKHWLPSIIGEGGMRLMGEYRGYDPNVDPSISNVFATAALRMGHGLINPIIQRLNSSFLPIPEGHLPLHKALFAPWRIVEEGGIDPVLRGLFAGPAKIRLSDQLLNSELTEQLFRTAHVVAQDLASLNIQRGRDHGLPSYNSWRKFCGLTEADNFYELRGEIKSQNLREKLQQLYGHPGNIDIWVGGMAEDHVDGAKVGPTFQCLLADQFRRLRNGDRFWYENPGHFKPEQLLQVKQVLLSKIICESGDNIQDVPRDAFRLPKESDFVKCDTLADLDLRYWMECCSECDSSTRFNTISGDSSNRLRRSLEAPLGDGPMTNPSQLTKLSAHGSAVSTHQKTKLAKIGSSKYLNVTNVEQEKKKRRKPEAQKITEDEDLIDIEEERLEGLESVMVQMQRLIRKLNTKIEVLEAKCGRHPKAVCQDHKGDLRKNGDRWETDECEDCLCEDGKVRCAKINCPVNDCEEVVLSEGSCCPVCILS